MKISGTAVLNSPVDQVWAAFRDPAVLARTIPGCQELRETGPDTYAMTVTAGVASIKGIYDGKVTLTEQSPPGYLVLSAAGAGAPGTVGADVKISLLDSATGGTALTYDADAVVGGVIGGVGQRMLTGVARKMAGQFFAAIDADIAGLRAPAEMPEAAFAPAGAPGLPTYAGRAAGVRQAAAGGAFQGKDFLYGAVVGAVIALGGVAVGRTLGRR